MFAIQNLPNSFYPNMKAATVALSSTTSLVCLLFISGCVSQSPTEPMPASPGLPPALSANMPTMVSLPGNVFFMGDQVNSGDLDEKPVHRVQIAPFLIAKNELSFAEYDVFAKTTGRRLPDDNGWGRGKRPVINVSYDDALAYTEWLSDMTGKSYSLPSEAQWEYAARAGAMTLYSNGNREKELCKVGNIADLSATAKEPHWEVTACLDNATYTSLVGSYSPNAYGLHDMHGNVWEWTKDCYQDSYRGAPQDGSVVDWENCKSRVIRGGSFKLPAASARLSNRESLAPNHKNNQVGFRVVLIP